MKGVIEDKWGDILEDKDMKFFDVIVGNPPYQGKGDPLYMQITKAAYDTALDESGVMCMINPTSLIDNKFEGNANFENLKTKYNSLKLKEIIYESGMLGVFTSAEIANDIAIFIYGYDGEHTLFDTYVKIKRFGDDYKIDKKIIDAVKGKPMIGDYKKYIYIPSQNKLVVKKHNIPGNNYVVCSFNRGHRDKITGDRKWDWPTLMNSDNFLIQTKLPINGQSSFDFEKDRNNALNWIKWINTDFICFFVLYYKSSLANPRNLFERLPQPPVSGDFSDKSIMKEFGLTKDQMEHIHKKMKDFGWKTRELIPDHKESSLLQFIDDLNNGKADDE